MRAQALPGHAGVWQAAQQLQEPPAQQRTLLAPDAGNISTRVKKLDLGLDSLNGDVREIKDLLREQIKQQANDRRQAQADEEAAKIATREADAAYRQYFQGFLNFMWGFALLAFGLVLSVSYNESRD